MSEYQEQFKKWDYEIGRIPDHTCPAINSAQRDLGRVEDYLKSIYKKCETCSDEASSAISEVGDVLYALEKLRKENEKLREYGFFWRKRCLNVCDELDAHIRIDANA